MSWGVIINKEIIDRSETEKRAIEGLPMYDLDQDCNHPRRRVIRRLEWASEGG